MNKFYFVLSFLILMALPTVLFMFNKDDDNSIGKNKEECLVDTCKMACQANGYKDGDYNKKAKYNKWLSCNCLRDNYVLEMAFDRAMFFKACDDVNDEVNLKQN